MFFLIGGGRLTASAAVAFEFEFGDPLFQSLDAIPEHENQIRNGIGVSLGQGDEFVTSRSLHVESTQ
jgi:hypothetical protein